MKRWKIKFSLLVLCWIEKKSKGEKDTSGEEVKIRLVGKNQTEGIQMSYYKWVIYSVLYEGLWDLKE